MMSSAPNPRALQRCLPGRAYATCAHLASLAATAPIFPANPVSTTPHLPLPAGLRLPSPRPKDTDTLSPSHPNPRPTSRKTKQNPFKIDLPAKV
jgi:hypothetical protein